MLVPKEETSVLRKGYLLVLGAAALGPMSGILIRYILSNQPIPPLPLAFGREFLTFTILLLGLGLTKPGLLRVQRRDLPLLMATGTVGLGLFHVLWVYAISQISIAIATVLNYTAPAFVALLSWLLWRETITARKLLALVLTFSGGVLVTRAYEPQLLRIDGAGLAAGLGTGVTFALYSILSKQALERNSPWTVMAYSFGFSSLGVFLIQPVSAFNFVSSSLQTWGFVAVLAVVATIAPFALFTTSLRYLKAGVSILTMMIELPLAALLAYLIFGQTLVVPQVLGSCLIFWGVIMLSLTAQRKARIEANPTKIFQGATHE